MQWSPRAGINFRMFLFSYYNDSRKTETGTETEAGTKKEVSARKVLSDITFTIEAGETVGIIGATGCGKTSLVQLIPRLYENVDEAVSVWTVWMSETIRCVISRDGVGIVLQKKCSLFGNHCRRISRWGGENADMDTIRAAAAGLCPSSKFRVLFSGGYETNLSRGGVNVSGGQKQRLCIARALIKKPKILIFG